MTVPYSLACHVPPSLYIYITIPGAGGDSPAGLGGNDVIRRLLHVGRRCRGRHSMGVLFACPPIPYSTISHAPFSRYSNFSHRNGGGIQQQLGEVQFSSRSKLLSSIAKISSAISVGLSSIISSRLRLSATVLSSPAMWTNVGPSPKIFRLAVLSSSRGPCRRA
jgi:hypothetical protein